MQYCSLKHQTSLSPPDTSATNHHFCFGQATSLSSHWSSILSRAIRNCPPLSPVAYWTPSDLGGSSSGVVSFCFPILSLGSSRQEYWSGLSFPPPVFYVLSELPTVACPSWVALHDMAHSFIELCQPLLHNKAVIHEGAYGSQVKDVVLNL